MEKTFMIMKQNEIWLVDLNPTVGAEFQKIRPSIIVSNDAAGKLPLRIIIPITDWKTAYFDAPWLVRLRPNQDNSLQKISAADCFQVRSVSENRFTRKIGTLANNEVSEIKTALTNIFSLP